MNSSTAPVQELSGLSSLRPVVWKQTHDVRTAVARRCRDTAHQRSTRRRTARIAVAWVVLISGAAVAAGAAHAFVNTLYTVTITDARTGKTLSAPRVLVAPGQSAQVVVEEAGPDGAQERLEVTIHPDGSVTSASTSGPVEIDVDAQPVPVVPAGP